ncbi:MAG: hypothetical protein ACYC8T_27450 [Myxococcaceae bacterium]
MNTRAAIVCALALLAAGCGNWSNADLEFQNALPRKDVLQSKPPAHAVNQGELSGIAQRQDPLVVGESSKVAADAMKGSKDFNSWLDGLLGVIEAVRSYPPTLRESTRRIWGPYPDKEHPGFEVRVVMDKADDVTFDYRIEFRRTGAGEWFAPFTGSFLASSGLHKGSGALTLSLKTARANGLPAPGTMETLDIAYVTDADPVYVAMDIRHVTPLIGEAKRESFKSRSYADGGGRIDYLATNPVVSSLVGSVTVAFAAAWLPSGEGRAQGKASAGTTTYSYAECWDADFTTRWFQTWGSTAAEGQASENCTGTLTTLLK